jgi:hypothetical protein
MTRLHPFVLALSLTVAATTASANTCYLRQYSADHLKSHPAQQVTAIGLSVQPDGRTLDLYVKLRPGPVRAMGTAYCDQDGEGLDCFMEGDAGRFSLTGGAGGALRLSVAPRGISFETEADFITISGTSGDDRVFMLPPLGRSDCIGLTLAQRLD